MRRNQRGSGRGSQNWQGQRQMAPGGPIMTDHLGLQDIDKELELLKRKREIIEQQQKMLRRNDYQEPQFSQSSRFDDYAQLYEDMRSYDAPNRKRPIAVWEDDIPNKRFSGQSQSRPRSRGFTRPPAHHSGPTRGGYQGSQPRQPYRPPAPSKSKPQPKKDHPKVTKTIAAPESSINKLKNYSASQRKKLIGDAAPLTQSSGGSGSKENDRLRADCEPSKQLNGRLELALGSIIKDIRAKEEHSDAVKSIAVMRQIKKTVRERIREIMMDQIVGASETIKTRYREFYDLQSDDQIVADAKKAVNEGTTGLKIVNPEEYFKTNMNKIATDKMKSMLKKLEDDYRAEFNVPEESGDAAETSPADAVKTEMGLDENIYKTEKFRAFDKLVSFKIVTLIKKYAPYILRIMDIDTKYTKLKNSITSETVKSLIQKHGQGEVSIENIVTAMQSDATPKAKTPYKPLPYYAKLMGKPSLPKRPLMETFFEEFKPKSIKKHRTVHNLLFVGFNEKESYDKMLAADGTKIGKHTLSIRVSDRSNTESKKEVNTSTKSEEKILGAELDEQITDLLTSIRKETNEQENKEITENTDTVSIKTGETKVENETEIGEAAAEAIDEGIATNVANGNADGENWENDDADNLGNADGENWENDDADNLGNADEENLGTAEDDLGNAEDNLATAEDNLENAEDNLENAEDNLENAEDNLENADEDYSENADTNNAETDEPTNDAQTDTLLEGDQPLQDNDSAIIDTKPEQENGNTETAEKDDKVPAIPDAKVGKGTPARQSARLAATPGRIQTRRTSKFVQNDA